MATEPTGEPFWLNFTQLAKRLGVPRNKLYQFERMGMPVVKVDRQNRVIWSEFVAWAKEQQTREESPDEFAERRMRETGFERKSLQAG